MANLPKVKIKFKYREILPGGGNKVVTQSAMIDSPRHDNGFLDCTSLYNQIDGLIRCKTQNSYKMVSHKIDWSTDPLIVEKARKSQEAIDAEIAQLKGR